MEPGLRLYARLEIKGGGRVRIGRDCHIYSDASNRRRYVTIYTHHPHATIQIGERARLLAARISSRHHVSIGNDVVVDDAGIVDTDFHSLESGRAMPNEHPEKCRVSIRDRVAIGSRAIVCKGVTIGEDAAILPGSIVNRSIPAGVVACGNPARPLASERVALDRKGS
jgi:acetyltransferase-like isoleucine patch superfamily enzyme